MPARASTQAPALTFALFDAVEQPQPLLPLAVVPPSVPPMPASLPFVPPVPVGASAKRSVPESTASGITMKLPGQLGAAPPSTPVLVGPVQFTGSTRNPWSWALVPVVGPV